MSKFLKRFYLILALVLTGSLPEISLTAATSQWVYFDDSGRLAYRSFRLGDHIMDFSHAGYGGGGVRIPTLPDRLTVSPSGGDDSDAIQNAINEVSQMPLRGGFRGAVRLAPGVFNCSKTLTIKSSGVVLRGSGTIENITTIRFIGRPHLCFSLGGGGEPGIIGRPVAITDAYVPSGADSFHVKDAAGLEPGDTILIDRPATPAWVRFMGMDTLVRNGRQEHWVSGEMHTERTVRSVSGNLVTLTVPLADSFDSRYLNPFNNLPGP